MKDELRKYFTSISSRFPIAVTLTFKQSYAVHTVKGTHYKKLDSDAVKRAVKHFQNKLNQQVYGSAAKRYGKKLSYIPVIEGEKSGKHLHVHMVIGDIPQHVMLNQIDTLVTKAKTSVELIDEQHKV
ncbi:MAG: hypothetical protein KGI88_07035 [Betaproteobacteria bacterium]|nr:hypothetical protein [Betaproteobacteria bacterium]